MPELTFSFDMPVLSAYTFFVDGTIRNKRVSNNLKSTTKGNTVYYRVYQDNEQWGYITPDEIISYGKHLQALGKQELRLMPKVIIYRPIIKFPSRAKIT